MGWKSIGGAIVGGLMGGPQGAVAGYSIGGAMEQNQANSAQAARQMEFQQYNSDTSYQRRVLDLKRAGLNPMLAYSQGGASTPGGASAEMQNTAEAGIRGYSTASQVANVAADTDLKKSSADLNSANAAKARAETPESPGPSATTPGQLLYEERFRNVQKTIAEKDLTHAEEDRVRQDILNLKAAKTETEAKEALARVEATLKRFDIPAARNRAASDETEYGKKIRPYVRDVGDIASPATSAFGAYVGARGGAGGRTRLSVPRAAGGRGATSSWEDAFGKKGSVYQRGGR